MIATYGLTHLQLTVRDLARSLRFYQQLFGMKVLFRVGEHMVMLQTPGTREILTLNGRPDGEAEAGTMGGVAHFGFRLSAPRDMREVLEEVAQAGGKPLEHGVRGKGGEETWAFATDPDGYGVELFYAPD